MDLAGLRLILEEKHQGAVEDAAASPPDNDELLLNAAFLRPVCDTLKHHPRLSFRLMADLCCVDLLAWPGFDPATDKRFMLVYHLYSVAHNRRLRLKTLAGGDDPAVDSVAAVWRAADWPEREIHEMFGVRFNGRGDLKPLFLYEEFQGHPLCKDYPLKGQQPVVDLRAPLPLREDPAHFQTAFEKAYFRPVGLTQIDNTARLPESMLAEGALARLSQAAKAYKKRHGIDGQGLPGPVRGGGDHERP